MSAVKTRTWKFEPLDRAMRMSLTSGFGDEVAAVIAEEAFESLDAPVKRVGALDVPLPFSPPLEDAVLPSPQRIEAEARKLLEY